MSALGSTWRSIWRFHSLLACILVLEYALAFAILLTTLGVLAIRAQAVNEASGVKEPGLYILHGEGIRQPVHRAELFEARARFQAVAGRDHVAVGASVPFWGRDIAEMPISIPGDPLHSPPLQINAYEGEADFASVLGLRILQGRGFQPDEVVQRFGDTSHVTILSASLARRLFHGHGAVGRQVVIAGNVHTVVGVMSSLAAPQYLGAQRTDYTLLLPRLPSSGSLLSIRYHGQVANLEDALSALRQHDMGKVNWSLVPYASIRSGYFRSDRLTVAALAVVVCVVLVTALCGILGLTSYWISRRRLQIAICRALGAKRRDIILHFAGESALLVVMGLMLGVILYFLSGNFIGNFRVNFGAEVWLLSTISVLLLATLVVFASLRRWLRMEPAELMRAI
jgi:putative ABC transport system permease protein